MLSGAPKQSAFLQEECTWPTRYLELHSTDATRAKSFYAELFGWKTKDTPV